MIDLEKEKYTFPNDKKEVDNFKLSTDAFYGICAFAFFLVVFWVVFKVVNVLIEKGILK